MTCNACTHTRKHAARGCHLHEPVEKRGGLSHKRDLLHGSDAAGCEGRTLEGVAQEGDGDEESGGDLVRRTRIEVLDEPGHAELANDLDDLKVPELDLVRVEEKPDAVDGIPLLLRRAVPPAEHRQRQHTCIEQPAPDAEKPLDLLLLRGRRREDWELSTVARHRMLSSVVAVARRLPHPRALAVEVGARGASASHQRR
eukprot:2528002-Rhodomonas_salina.2